MGTLIDKILVPVDFSEFSKNALHYAVQFARQSYAGKLYLIYVIEPVIYPADFSMGQVALPSVELEVNSKAKEELENLARKEIPEGLGFETIIKTGKPFVEINETASEIDADLIIIASHGHSGVEQILFGSTAEKVVRKAPCPVLSLRMPVKGFNVQSLMGKHR
ncbi:MAG: universal stress protein [Ignavibacteria bacterium]|jgi:nucleotide-binding universal stress UspA family protein|nr:universal stress protein [Ignavibacteria bacterium]MCU7501474.1 universal stress protein [Ignavibacteria bacterium]MCU7516010.1 universal stress protein [Ignavibacteria bacterium]